MKRQPLSEIPEIRGSKLTLKRLLPADAAGLEELVGDREVYRYLPTFLFEKKYSDVSLVIERLYDECLRESLILGVFAGADLCGLAELYGHRAPIRKISVGYRLLKRCWGRGIATEALGMMVAYLYNETDTEIITASTMVENLASANVLRKNGFELVTHAVTEDWGYEAPTIVDKWIR